MGSSRSVDSSSEPPEVVLAGLLCGPVKVQKVKVRELVATVQSIVASMSEDRRSAIVRRYSLDGEGAPIDDMARLAERNGVSITQVTRYLLRAEEQVRAALRSEFPVLMADPDPTPQTH